MVWEAVFFLVILKIPVAYLAVVVWWAIRDTPDKTEPAGVAVVRDTPPEGPGHGVCDRARRRPAPAGPERRPAGPRQLRPAFRREVVL
jgi:hypothetical protein